MVIDSMHTFYILSDSVPTDISEIYARQIFDSHGNPTVEVDLTTEIGKR